MKYTTIFFDLDDTLIDTVKCSKEALEDMYGEHKFATIFHSFDDFFNRYRRININLWDLYEHGQIDKEQLKKDRFQKTLKDLNLNDDQSLKLNDEFMARVSEKKNIIDGAIDILEYLYPKYNLHILSNGFNEVQDSKIEKAGMASFFKNIILSDHIGKNKPHPLIFDHALKKAHVTSNESIMIGDNINTDIIGAKNCGIDQIWFNPKHIEDKEIIRPTFQIEKLEEIRMIL